MKKNQAGFKARKENTEATIDVICSWCGAIIRSNASRAREGMCLICHARLLNDYFQRVKKRTTSRAPGGQSTL
jgi:hypothetical protein